jgi:dsRNA-specific ribonuclease
MNQQAEAWIGDAILALYARSWILRRTEGAVDGEMYGRLTANQFLANFGDPGEVEARIGRVYEAEGLEAAFGWIERELMPLFERQEAKRGKQAKPDKREKPRR